MTNVSDSVIPSGQDTTPPGGELEPGKMRMIELLAGGSTVAEAAKAINKSERTLFRWRRDPQVRAELRARLDVALERARSVLSNGAAAVAEALVKMGTGKIKPDMGRIAAARTVLEHARGLSSDQDIAELSHQLAELEERIGKKGKT